MLASAKYIGAGVACSGLIGAGAYIGVVLGFLIFVCCGVVVVVLPLIYLAGKAGEKILDLIAKSIVIAAGSSTLYKNHGGGSGSSGDDKDKDKDKDKAKEDKEKEDTKTNTDTKNTADSNAENNTAAK
jgi:hypothetical protein